MTKRRKGMTALIVLIGAASVTAVGTNIASAAAPTKMMVKPLVSFNGEQFRSVKLTNTQTCKNYSEAGPDGYIDFGVVPVPGANYGLLPFAEENCAGSANGDAWLTVGPAPADTPDGTWRVNL